MTVTDLAQSEYVNSQSCTWMHYKTEPYLIYWQQIWCLQMLQCFCICNWFQAECHSSVHICIQHLSSVKTRVVSSWHLSVSCKTYQDSTHIVFMLVPWDLVVFLANN